MDIFFKRKKEKSKHDGREFRIVPTEKFYEFYGHKANYGEVIMNNIEKSLEKDDMKKMDKVLDVLIEKVFKPRRKKKARA